MSAYGAYFKPGGQFELMGRKEVAACLDCKEQNLPVGLPDPLIDYLSRGSLWLASDIREFAEGRGA